MKRKNNKRKGLELSLVPLADMLTNTVGILLFILIFTVLTGGGVIVPKRLPIERPIKKLLPITFFCTNGRVIYVDSELINKFVQPLGELTYYTVKPWIEKFNKRQMESDYFYIKGEGTYQDFYYEVYFNLTYYLISKPEVGETISQVQTDSSFFKKILQKYPPQKYFVDFVVSNTDGINIFRNAREVASQMKFDIGWFPESYGDTVVFSNRGAPMTID